MDKRSRIKEWENLLATPDVHPEDIINASEGELEEWFDGYLTFGTGGMRGIVGPGTNRLNTYIVIRITLALAEYIQMNPESGKNGVAISYDSRHFSQHFAQTVAAVLASKGINVFLSDTLRPTPLLSYAVRKNNARMGIMITASHNPPVYNGYKVYDSDGAQITLQAADAIAELMEKLPFETNFPQFSFDSEFNKGKITLFGEGLENSYIEDVAPILQQPSLGVKSSNFKIVYTPLHGTGYAIVPKILNRYGYKNVEGVPSQMLPDGDFPTVISPNPEEECAFEEAIQHAIKVGADIVFATDPDADRLGVAAKDNTGEYKLLSGNQLGVLLLDYLVQFQTDEQLKNAFIAETIVTSDMGEAIATAHGIRTERTLTGFKYIGEKIKDYEKSEKKHFLFGFEESYGYLALPIVRDKDAVQIVLLTSEMALHYKLKKQSIWNRLADLYEKYGYYEEALIPVDFEGVKGKEQLESLLNRLRKIPPKKIGNEYIVKYEDFLLGNGKVIGGDIYPLNFPEENVLKFYLKNDSWFTIRMSGTEPKCKVYFSVKSETKQKAENKLLNLIEDVRIVLGL